MPPPPADLSLPPPAKHAPVSAPAPAPLESSSSNVSAQDASYPPIADEYNPLKPNDYMKLKRERDRLQRQREAEEEKERRWVCFWLLSGCSAGLLAVFWKCFGFTKEAWLYWCLTSMFFFLVNLVFFYSFLVFTAEQMKNLRENLSMLLWSVSCTCGWRMGIIWCLKKHRSESTWQNDINVLHWISLYMSQR